MNPQDGHQGYQIDESITWQHFIRDCGKMMPENAALRNYKTKYLGKYVQWEGRVMRIDGNEQNYLH